VIESIENVIGRISFISIQFLDYQDHFSSKSEDFLPTKWMSQGKKNLTFCHWTFKCKGWGNYKDKLRSFCLDLDFNPCDARV